MTASFDVWERMKSSAQKMPNRALSSMPSPARKTPFRAERFTMSASRSPSARDSRALTPTAVPVAMPIMMFCTGKASETALSAS